MALFTNARSRQIAIVGANSEDDARLFASDADPFGHEWRDPMKFVCDTFNTEEDHVVGDVIFRSVPIELPASLKPKRQKK